MRRDGERKVGVGHAAHRHVPVLELPRPHLLRSVSEDAHGVGGGLPKLGFVLGIWAVVRP